MTQKYSIRKCRGHWHVMIGEGDDGEDLMIKGDPFKTAEEAQAVADKRNAGIPWEEIESPAASPPSLDAPAEPFCNAEQSKVGIGYACTLRPGHEGDHQAHGTSGKLFQTWPQEEGGELSPCRHTLATYPIPGDDTRLLYKCSKCGMGFSEVWRESMSKAIPKSDSGELERALDEFERWARKLPVPGEKADLANAKAYVASRKSVLDLFERLQNRIAELERSTSGA